MNEEKRYFHKQGDPVGWRGGGPPQPSEITYRGQTRWFRTTAEALRWAHRLLGLPEPVRFGRERLDKKLAKLPGATIRYLQDAL